MVIYLFYPIYLIKCQLSAGGLQRLIKNISKIKLLRKIIFIISYPILNFNKSLKDHQKFILKVLFFAMLTFLVNYNFNMLLKYPLILLVLIVLGLRHCIVL